MRASCLALFFILLSQSCEPSRPLQRFSGRELGLGHLPRRAALNDFVLRSLVRAGYQSTKEPVGSCEQMAGDQKVLPSSLGALGDASFGGATVTDILLETSRPLQTANLRNRALGDVKPVENVICHCLCSFIDNKMTVVKPRLVYRQITTNKQYKEKKAMRLNEEPVKDSINIIFIVF